MSPASTPPTMRPVDQLDPAPPRAEPSPARGGMLRRWFGGWRVSVRMAQRDIRRHRWRSMLITAMIGLPVVLMVGGLVGYDTQQISASENMPARFGSAQGLITGRITQVPLVGSAPGPIRCGADNLATTAFDGSWEFDNSGESRSNLCSPGTPARAIPGISTPDASAASVTTALAAITGSRVVPVRRSYVDVQVGDRVSQVPGLSIDGRDPAARGMVDLTSGRWPQTPDEVVLTQFGERMGLGDRPRWRPQRAKAWTEATVVGTAHVAVSSDRGAAAVITAPPTDLGSVNFLLDRTTPLTWPDVQRLTTYGLVAYSRAVASDPPQAARAVDALVHTSGDALSNALGTALLCLGLLLESCLLAGPAFAVVAQRQRRALALAALNGADRAQLRRTMLAEAVVLGVVTAIGGALVGVFLAWVGITVWQRLPLTLAGAPQIWGAPLGEEGLTFGPVSVPWVEIGIVIAFAVIAAVVSALVPARGLGRLDVVSALRDEVVSARPRRGWPILGAVSAVAGTVAIFAAVILRARGLISDAVTAWGVVGAGLILVIGVLMLVPVLLMVVARFAAVGTVSVRIAVRDAVRQRGRSVPTVAAVMAGAIVLSGASLAPGTYDRQAEAWYTPIAPIGQAIIHDPDAADRAEIRRAVLAVAPGAALRRVARAVLPDEGDGSGKAPQTSRAVMILPPGCTAQRVLTDIGWAQGHRDGACDALALSGWLGASPLVVASVPDAAALFGLDERAQSVLRHGGAALTTSKAGAPMPVVSGVMNIEPKASGGGEWGRWGRETGRRVIQTAPMTPPSFSLEGPTPLGVLTPATAAALGLTVQPTVTVVDANGALTAEQVQRINTASTRDGGVILRLEQGYRSATALLQLGLFVVVLLLILVATVTTTLLSMGEQRQDLATLAAVGAGNGIRRRIAAVQAGLLAFLGTLLGLLVGAVPGTAFALTITGAWNDATRDGAFVDVPWGTLFAMSVLVPLASATLAALFVPRRPDLTRRAS